jgi:hypothetical protein
MQYFLIGMYNSSNRRAGYNAANFVMKKKEKTMVPFDRAP